MGHGFRDLDNDSIRVSVLTQPRHASVYGVGSVDYATHFVSTKGRIRFAVFPDKFPSPIPPPDEVIRDGFQLLVETASGQRFIVNVPISYDLDPDVMGSRLDDFLNQATALAAAGLGTADGNALALTLSAANLPASSVGEARGTATAPEIVLDVDAAGYGWYIDATPTDSSEPPPTRPCEAEARTPALQKIYPARRCSKQAPTRPLAICETSHAVLAVGRIVVEDVGVRAFTPTA
jgi:hypothetical protein